MRRFPTNADDDLRDPDDVWLRVVEFARASLRSGQPVFTVSQRVENYITDVREGSIGRASRRGTSNSSRVTRTMVRNVWSELRGHGRGSGYPYFAKALVLAALPGVVEDMDGKLVLSRDPAVLEIKRARADGLGGGEGPEHRELKELIYSNPDVALAGLGSGPYQRVAMEYAFPTGDRVDVVLIDAHGNVVLVEVKPVLFRDDPAPFAQAAKYRTLWSILRERPLAEVRCVVAAPGRAGTPWRAMREKYEIECVVVRRTGRRPPNSDLRQTPPSRSRGRRS